jgi:hypothetical protein
MATTYPIYRGGPCFPGCLPANGPQMPAVCPQPKRIAAEFAHGYFFLSGVFNPRIQAYQKNFLSKSPIVVGDKFDLILVPEKHTILDVAWEVGRTQEVHPNNYRVIPNMAGLVVDFYLDLYDKDCVKTGTVALTDGGCSLPHAGVDCNVDSSGRSSVTPTLNGEYLCAGKYARIGFEVKALPSTAGVTLGDISGFIHVGTHAMANDFINVQ